MPFWNKKAEEVEGAPCDCWFIEAFRFALLLHVPTKLLCLAIYTFITSLKNPSRTASVHSFLSTLLAATGGGILVPLFLNVNLVPLASDYYFLFLGFWFSLLLKYPILAEVYDGSPLLQFFGIIGFELHRASVVVKLTFLAASVLPSSVFSFPMFGPIVCGTLGGCGGAFFPLSKGLEPLREGVSGPMTTAFLGSAGLHLFVNDPFEVFRWCSDREEVGAICVSLLFVGASLSKFYKVIKEKKD
mmetsp:Transcript_7505/g.13564  ORF Transcript_7505/g.13564 Transcript_7505/m.13564 type:complete len:244 (-) Transcript_7505:146-877(-)